MEIKGILKVRSSCFSVILLLLSMLANNNSEVNEYNIKNYLDSDCTFVADYIEKNFGLFVEKYNESSEEELTASYVENSFEIMILDHEVEKKDIF